MSDDKQEKGKKIFGDNTKKTCQKKWEILWRILWIIHVECTFKTKNKKKKETTTKTRRTWTRIFFKHKHRLQIGNQKNHSHHNHFRMQCISCLSFRDASEKFVRCLHSSAILQCDRNTNSRTTLFEAELNGISRNSFNDMNQSKVFALNFLFEFLFTKVNGIVVWCDDFDGHQIDTHTQKSFGL